MAKHTTRSVNTQLEANLQDNPAYQADLDATLAALVPEGWVQDQVSFPPYWKPDLAKGFRGTVIARDERDGSFPRYIIESSLTVDCQQGPVNDGVIVTVEPGMNFSIGAYAALPLEKYFGLEITAIVVGARKLPGNEASVMIPRDLWEWKVMVSPETSKLLKSRRAEDMAFLKEAQRIAHRKAMEELARSSAESRAHRLAI